MFLLNLEFDYFPLDYVGDLKYFEDIIRPILWEFVPYLQRQPKYIDYAMKRYRTRGMKQRGEKQEFDEVVIIIEKFMGFQLDPKKISVQKYYSYLKTIEKHGKAD